MATITEMLDDLCY